MDKFIKEEIERFKPFMSQLQFEGVSLEKIINTLIKHLIVKNNSLKHGERYIARGK